MASVREVAVGIMDKIVGQEEAATNEELIERYIQWQVGRGNETSQEFVALLGKALVLQEEDVTSRAHVIRSKGVRFGIALLAARLAELGNVDIETYYRNFNREIGIETVIFLHDSISRSTIIGEQPFMSFGSIMESLDFVVEDTVRLGQRLSPGYYRA